ncbi:uncharacterized protein RBU33_011350 [Hipposideros larvatus]
MYFEKGAAGSVNIHERPGGAPPPRPRAGPPRPPPAFVPFPPPAGPPSSAHAGAAPSPQPGAPAGSRRPHASAGRARWREGREPATSPALHPPARGRCALAAKAENLSDTHRRKRREWIRTGLPSPRASAPRTPSASRSEPDDDPALPAAALRGRRPRPAAPRHRRDLPRPAPGSRPPREGVGRGGGGRRTLPSPRRAGPGPRSGARDRQVTEVPRSAAAPSCFPGAHTKPSPPSRISRTEQLDDFGFADEMEYRWLRCPTLQAGDCQLLCLISCHHHPEGKKRNKTKKLWGLLTFSFFFTRLSPEDLETSLHSTPTLPIPACRLGSYILMRKQQQQQKHST